jgi:hypothetical protein
MMNQTHSASAVALANYGDTITRLDALAQDGFSGIAAIAKRALQGLDAADGTLPPTEALATALRAIWGKAERFGNDINVKAEEAGCNWVGKH